jgi:mannose-6-phosphate isomerase-like protein (cupin superfamily)
MSDAPTHPYVTVMPARYASLERVEVGAIADACEHRWYNETMCQVNDSLVRMAVVQGEYHWHKHQDDDEFFYVVEGHLSIDLEDRVVELDARQGVVIPKGLLHRPRAAVRTVMLMMETRGIVPTGS